MSAAVSPNQHVPAPRTPRSSTVIGPIVAGLLVVLVSYSGPALLIRLAADNAKLPDQLFDSWLFAVSVGSGVAGLVLSWWLRQPIVVAYSTAGVVLLSTALQQYRYSEAIGSYLVVAVVCALIGVSGRFSSVLSRLPGSIIAAMLAGVLLRFGIGYFTSLPGEPHRWQITVLVAAMGAAYFYARARRSRLATVWACVIGLALSFVFRLTTGASTNVRLAHPKFTAPTLSLSALTGLALPLLALALSSQYAPGYAVLRDAGYEPNMDRVLGVTGALGLVLGPLGSPGLNLAAITAGIATSPDAHPDPDRRYLAGIATGVFYILAGVFGSSLLDVFKLVSKEFVAAITGLALFGTLVNAAATALADPDERDAAGATMLCAAGGFTLFQIGAPFWALVIGVAVGQLPKLHRPSSTRTARTP